MILTTRMTPLAAAAVLALLVGCGTDDGNATVDTGADASDDASNDVDRDTDDPDTREDPLDDTDPDVEMDIVEGECLDVIDFTCCDGGVEFIPGCGRDGWVCERGSRAEIGGCSEDVGFDSPPDVDDVDASVCDETSNAEESESPERTVVFSLNNTTDSVRYVVLGGWLCGGYAIDGPGGAVQLMAGWECLCECPNPGSAYPSRFAVVEPGSTATFDWDARQLRSSSRGYDCAANGWSGCTTTNEYWRESVADGDYTISMASYDADAFAAASDQIGLNCFDNGDGVLDCDADSQQGEIPSNNTYAPMCENSGEEIVVEFALGADDLTVEVSL